MKTIDIGFIFLDINNNEISDIVFNTVSEFANNNPFGQTIIFSSKCDKIDTRNIPILHLSHSKFFDGDLVLLDIPSLIITKSFTNYQKKYFYALDIPWLNNLTTNYTRWRELIGDQSLNIIASNQDVYDLYDTCWKKPLGIAENFNYEKLHGIISN